MHEGDSVVEIGPGLGTLTGALLNKGARVYAVEYDTRLYNHLEESLLPKYPESLSLIHEDALKAPLASLPQETALYKIVANLPYAISTPWLEKVLSEPNLPQCIVVMLQKEAADRFTAEPGTKSMGAISIFLNTVYEPVATHPVSHKCFYPQPDVGSVLLALKLKEKPFIFHKETKQLIRAFFTQRRKQIGALIRQHKDVPQLRDWQDWLAANNLADNLRSEALPIKAWQQLDIILCQK